MFREAGLPAAAGLAARAASGPAEASAGERTLLRGLYGAMARGCFASYGGDSPGGGFGVLQPLSSLVHFAKGC